MINQICIATSKGMGTLHW